MLVAPLLGIGDAWVWGAAFASGFALRSAAIRWEWGLPSYGGRGSA
jgi:uncharacterized membrane protein YeiH